MASAQDWGMAQTVGSPQLRNVAQLDTAATRAAQSGATETISTVAMVKRLTIPPWSRHLSPGQQASILSSAQDWSTAHSRGGDRKSDQSQPLDFDTVEKRGGTGANQHTEQSANVSTLRTAADRAVASGASIATQRMADTVAKADPELAKMVAHGILTLPQAVKRIKAKRKKPSRSGITFSLREVTPGPPGSTQERLHREEVSAIYRGCMRLRTALSSNPDMDEWELDAIREVFAKISEVTGTGGESSLCLYGQHFLQALTSKAELTAQEKEMINKIAEAVKGRVE